MLRILHRHPKPIDATRLVSRLWIGSAPKPGPHWANEGFDVIVFCAQELREPKAHQFPGVDIMYAGFDDAELTPTVLQIASNASDVVAQQLDQGRRCLVTCAQGRNRSGLVCALTMLRRMPGTTGKDILRHIQRERKDALTNPQFAALLKTMHAPPLEVIRAV